MHLKKSTLTTKNIEDFAKVQRYNYSEVAKVSLQTIARADFVIQEHQSLWFTPQFKAISECRQKKFSQAENLPSPAPKESSPYWFQGNFAPSFVLNFCLREFLLSAFANRFELRCELKRLMLLYYKICPCYRQSLQRNRP